MLAPFDFSKPADIVELGPGTGALTAIIAARLSPRHRYLGIEINPRFVRPLRARFPGLVFAHASVVELGAVLEVHGWTGFDMVVSGLPWASLPIGLQTRAFAELARHARPGAVLTTFAYLHGLAAPGSIALRRRMRATFKRVERGPIVWGNLPPALVYVGRWDEPLRGTVIPTAAG
ncbi:MAG TPA: methyltransferase [Acetobacteraceae bacterium]|nr:methyltransferase [Acetobacteraceae bacterium]